MKHANVKNGQGFTLLEVMITLVVLGVIGAFAARPLIGLIETRAGISDAAGQQGNHDYASTRIGKDIRFSTNEEEVKSCESDKLEVGNTVYEYDKDTQTLRVNDEIIAKEVATFTCDDAYANSLRLYSITLDEESFRVFKREKY